MDLIIVESPTKARTLSRFLPEKEYSVEATVGHVRDLPKSKLGIDVDNDFQPDWVMVKGKREVMRKIRHAGLKAKNILLATDPDREGEAIAWHVYDLLKKNSEFPLAKKTVKRITFHEITQSAVESAIQHAGELNIHLFDAQQARRVVDRLVGYKLSPVLWKKIRRGLSAGRVQSVAVRLVVERERERVAFKAEEYWEIVAELTLPHPPQKGEGVPSPNRRGIQGEVSNELSFFSWLQSINGQDAKIANEAQAMYVLADLDLAEYTVKDIQKREAKSRPSPPFTTSTLQQNAGTKLGWSAKQTMRIAQGLYEKGLITYHRTDSLNLSEQALEAVSAFIKKNYGDKYLPDKLRRYKTKAKVAQEAHEAIRPTKIMNYESGIKNNGLASSEEKLYKLIWQRFVACQMAEAIYDQTKITVEAFVGAGLVPAPKRAPTRGAPTKLPATSYQLLTEGKVRKFDGWMRVYGRAAHDDELPNLQPYLPLQLIEVTGGQRYTEPPPHYSEATLIKKLEQLGIGRPSTYAPIMSTIQDRGYVERVDGKLISTAVGETTNDFLVKHFPVELDYQFTAKMEDTLDCVARGECQWVPVVKDFYQPFAKVVQEAETAEREKVPTESTGKKCPDCATKIKIGELKDSEVGDVVIRTGRFGKFLSCSRFPDCKYTAKYLETIGLACPKCGVGSSLFVKEGGQGGVSSGGEVIIRKTKKGSRTFYGCSRWPECKWVSWNDPRKGVKLTPP